MNSTELNDKFKRQVQLNWTKWQSMQMRGIYIGWPPHSCFKLTGTVKIGRPGHQVIISGHIYAPSFSSPQHRESFLHVNKSLRWNTTCISDHPYSQDLLTVNKAVSPNVVIFQMYQHWLTIQLKTLHFCLKWNSVFNWIQTSQHCSWLILQVKKRTF